MWIVVVALIAIIVAAAIVAARARRPASAPPPAPLEAGRSDAARGEDDGVLWGLHVPGSPVQRMARSLAAGFVIIDPEETSRVVRSTDGGANWYVVPQSEWDV